MLVPARELGRRAGELLLRRLREDDESGGPESIVVPMYFSAV
jgi:DNA-binding LacI/PurR family transcriptional regulator